MRRFPLFSTPSLVIAALVGFVALATAAYAQTFITGWYSDAGGVHGFVLRP
jgi:hypothetical protein